uniref:Reticulocyte-binding protein 1a n=1 Tax=Plasmodium cynomolgi TaxID=5827 RepID=I6RCY8_9APIC|nr:reticulocyte-binding protein 1a [Plasmodium cynomolgi]
MKSGIYLATLLYLFNHIGAGHGENVEEDISKSEGKANFFSLDSNLKNHKKSKHNRVKRRNSKISNFLNQKSYVKETDNESGKDVEGSRPSHDSSFVNLNDPVNGKISSYSVHVKESTPHSTMQGNKEKEKENEKIHGVVNSFVQNQEEEVSDNLKETHKSIVNIKEKMEDDNKYNPVFEMETDFVDLHFFNIIRDLLPEGSKYHKYYEEALKEQITEYTDTLKKLIDSCISQKEQIIILKHDINYMKTKSVETETLGEKETELSETSKEYDIYIESYKRNLKPKINDIKNKASSVLNDSYCKENCGQYVQRYNTMRKKFISSTEKYEMETYIYIPKVIKDYGVIDSILLEANKCNIDIQEIANSLKFLGDEINEFSHLYKINSTLIDGAAEALKSINEETESAEIDAQEFEDKSKLLANNYCIFEYLKELNDSIKKKYESKIQKSNELLSKVIDSFRKRATALNKLTFDDEKCYKIKTHSDIIKEEAEEIYNRNEKIYDEIPDDEYEKINTLYDLKYEMEQCKYRIANNSDFISNKYKHLYESLKQTYEWELNNIDQLESDTVKVNLYSQQIGKINNQKNKIDDSLETVKNFYKHILEEKRKMDNVKIQFEKKVEEINRARARKIARASNEAEIKVMLEKMTQKTHYLKELLSLKEKSNVYFTEMNELLNTESYDNMDEFSAKKEKADNDMNALFNSVYRENINELIKSVENFVIENKESTREIPDEAVEQKLQNARETFSKLDFVSDVQLTDVYTKMSEKVTYAEAIKKEIAQKQFENVHNKLKELSDSFATKFDALENRKNQYNQEGDVIEKYKQNISEKEQEYFENVNVDENLPTERTNVQEYTKHKQNFSRQKGEISADITHMREIINKIESQLNYYGVIEKYFHLIGDENEVSKVKDLKEKIIIDSLRHKIDQYETEFKGKTSAVENIESNIQSLNRAIDSLKRLNDSINNCNKHKEDIALLRSKIKTVREEVQKEITETEGNIVVGQNTTALLLKNLRDKMEKINQKLNDNILNSLDTKKEDLLNFYLESKSQIHSRRDQKGPQDPLNRIDEWKGIKKEVDELNVKYDMISKNKVTLFKNNSVTYIEAMHSHINNVVQSIRSDKNETLKSVKAIEDKLNLVELNEDYKKVRNAENDKQIEAIRGSISKLKELINKHVGEMNQLESTSNSLKINAKKKENEQDLEELNKIKEQMRDNYEKLKKISEELKEGTINELKEVNETKEKLNNVELEFEKNIIGHILERITEEKDKARKGVEEMNSLKTKIENLIQKTSDESQNELVTTNITKHLENAKKYEDQIKRNEEESIQLREKAKNLETLDEVKNLVQQVNMNLQSAVQGNVDISKELNGLKGVNELLISTNYNSILEYIKKNSSESVRFIHLANEEFTKTEGEEKNARARFEEAEKLKEQIVKDLDYNDIDDKVNKIEGIKKEILRIKDSALTLGEKLEKDKKMCSSHLENTKEGKKKIEYLKNNGDGGKTTITDSQMKEVDDYVVKAENAFNEVEKQVEKTNVLYKSILAYVTKMENLFNESLMKEMKVKCEKKNDEAEKIFRQIKTVDGRIKARVSENEKKIGELKEKDKIEKKGFTELNDVSTMSLLEIDNYRKQLDTVLSDIERMKQNALQYFDAADKSMKSVLPISELVAENSLDKVKAAKEKYEKNLETVKYEMNRINMEEGNLTDIDKKITDIESDLLKMKKKYKEGLLQGIKENADKRKSNFELVRSEINSLVDPSTSIFIKFKLKEYDMTDDLKNYGVKMNGIHEQFTKSYNLLETHLSNATDYSVTSEKAQSLREEAEKEVEHLIKGEEEAIILLNNIKKVESSKLLKEMMKKVSAEYEGMSREYESVSQDVQNMKKIVDELKTLNDISECSSKLNDVVSIVKKVKESKQADYKRDAKSMYEIMVNLANYFLSDDAKISSEMEFNAEMKSNFKTDLESEIFSVVSSSNELLIKIEQDSNNVIIKQRESEQLAKDATDFYNLIKIKNGFNEKLEEVKNKEKVVTEKIREALNRLRQVEGIKCQFDNFHTLLNNTEELENLNKMVTMYHHKKKEAPKESELQEMDNDMNRYINSRIELEGIVLSAMESKEDIAKLERSNGEMGNISGQISTIDSKVMEMNSTIDELYELGKNCQSHWISLISYTANMKISKKLIMINKEKENIEKCVDFIKTKSSSTDDYVKTLKEFYNNKLTFSNASENVQNADTYSLNFAKHEKESLTAITNIKKELYSFHQNSDISIVEGSIKNIFVHYDKLNEEKEKMDNAYKNMNETKLKQIEHSSDVFKPVIELQKRMNETNNKSLLEKQKKLKSVEDNLNDMEAELIKNSLKYTPESEQNINNIYGSIEAEVKTLEEIDLDSSNNYQNVEEYKKPFSTLIDRTNTLMDDIENFKKENNYNLMEASSETIHGVSDYIEKITNKLVETKKEYEKILENIKQNDDMLQNIVLKKRSVIEFFDNLMKKKESILNDLYEQEKLHKIGRKLNEIKHNVSEIMSIYEINEHMEITSNNLLDKKSKIIHHTSIYDLEIEANEISSDVEQIKDDVKKLNIILRDSINKRGEMDAFFKKMSSDRNPNEYKSAEVYMNEASKIIHKLEVKIQGIDQLVKDSEGILSEINNKKSALEKEKTARTLRISENNRKEEEERAHGLEDEETTSPTDQTEMSGATLLGDDSTRSDEQDMHRENTQDGTYQDKSYSSDEENILNRKLNFNKVKYAGAFILLFTSGVIGVIMQNRKDNEEEADDGEEEHEVFEFNENMNSENKEEVIDVSFVDYDY